jgi:two-component system, LytTR family, sensor histidine kinase AlgZ
MLAHAAKLYAETLTGLFAPKRLVPILLVVFPVIMLQHRMSYTPGAAPLAVAMCAAFVLIAPAAWRVLQPLRQLQLSSLVGVATYGAIGVLVVALIGVTLPKMMHIPVTLLTTRASLIVCVALFWVGGWGLARDIDTELHIARETKRLEELQRAAKHAELLALRQHLDPHFLFNTLNAIAEWCREEPRTAERAILELSAVLRTVMAAIKTPTWSLDEELKLAMRVFSLHAIRDPERFQVESHLDTALSSMSVPPMVLLPLAENAMKHGPESGYRGTVVLRTRALGETVEISLSNPGPYKGRRAEGEGLAHVEERLKLAYGAVASLVIEAEGTDRTQARVTLPRVS